MSRLDDDGAIHRAVGCAFEATGIGRRHLPLPPRAALHRGFALLTYRLAPAPDDDAYRWGLG